MIQSITRKSEIVKNHVDRIVQVANDFAILGNIRLSEHLNYISRHLGNQGVKMALRRDAVGLLHSVSRAFIRTGNTVLGEELYEMSKEITSEINLIEYRNRYNI